MSELDEFYPYVEMSHVAQNPERFKGSFKGGECTTERSLDFITWHGFIVVRLEQYHRSLLDGVTDVGCETQNGRKPRWRNAKRTWSCSLNTSNRPSRTPDEQPRDDYSIYSKVCAVSPREKKGISKC
jgi:hypothetical protein